MHYPKEKREYYERMLRIVGSLSRLFSESNIPYLDSRIAENLYCKSFDAENKSRDDNSIDAVYNKIGIGIKTFQGNGAQKVAEFNKEVLEIASLASLEKAKKIAELRNKRIEFTKRKYAVDHLQYHCIRREIGKMIICECPMDTVDINKIKVLQSTGKTIKFVDGRGEYFFNVSKSVLLMKFPKQGVVLEIAVKILDDPFNILDSGLALHKKEMLKVVGVEYQYVVLPLYSIKNEKKIVPERSGLNQWNAAGRQRDDDEVYFRVPHWIHDKFPSFFPKRDVKFNLKLPDGNSLSAKICQDNDKALMSDPNKALGKWILRDVLQLKKGELLTFKMLQEIGIDSVIIKKTGRLEYSIDFGNEGEFEKFEDNYKSEIMHQPDA